MSIIILVLATISFFCFTVLPTLKHRVLYALLSFAIMVLCTGAIILNDSYNFGMKVQTITQKQKLVSSVPDQLDVLLYQPLGTKSERVYLYHNSSDEKKLRQTKTTDTTTKYSQTGKTPQLVVTKERYVYQNGLSELFFGILGNNDRLKHQTYEFKLTDNWVVLSTKHAKQLKKLIKEHDTELKQNISQVIQQELAQKLQQNPTMSSSEREKLVKELQKQATQQLVKKLIAQVQASDS